MIAWHCDHFCWSNQEVKPLPKHNPQVMKSYFQTDPPNGLSDYPNSLQNMLTN